MDDSSSGQAPEKSALLPWISLFVNSACLGFFYYFCPKIAVVYLPAFVEMKLELPSLTRFFLQAGNIVYTNGILVFPLAAMLFVILPAVETCLKNALLPDWFYVAVSVLLILFALLMYTSIMMPFIEVQKHLQHV